MLLREKIWRDFVYISIEWFYSKVLIKAASYRPTNSEYNLQKVLFKPPIIVSKKKNFSQQCYVAEKIGGCAGKLFNFY